MKTNNTLFGILIIALFTLISCTSSTRITTEPPGATVYIDGQMVGETPYLHEDSKVSFSKINLELKMEGYRDFNTIIIKDEEVQADAIVGGIFFFWPFIWTMGYLPNHHYELEPLAISDVEVKLPDKKAKQIQELNEMYKEGIIDLEEFEILKKRILGETEED